MTTTEQPKDPKDPYLILLDKQIKQLSKLEQSNLGCRIGAVGHNWQQVQPDWKPTIKGVQPMAKQCLICGTIVRYNISVRYGEYLSHPRYEYPEGYNLKSVTERIRPQAVRAEWARRMRNAVLPQMVFSEEPTTTVEGSPGGIMPD
jgi:hypothetical protein